jgi:hypothetical protein
LELRAEDPLRQFAELRSPLFQPQIETSEGAGHAIPAPQLSTYLV